MPRRWLLLAAGIVAYIVALIATAPATLLDAGLQRAGPGRVRLAEPSGTLWKGTGRIEVREAGGPNGVGRGISWRATPTSLLRGRLDYEVGIERTAQRFPLSLTFSRVEIADAELIVPAAVLGLTVPRLAPLELTGEMLIRVNRLSMADDRMNGSATVRWRAAGSALTPLYPLGEYELRLAAAETNVQASLTTIQGPLQLDGEGSWRQGNSVAFLATARVPQQHLTTLTPVLRLVAVEKGRGVFELQLK